MILKIILMLLFLFNCVFSQIDRADEWRSHEGVPLGIYAGGFVSCNDALYSLGGKSSEGVVRNNFQYDINTREWTPKASMQTTHMNAAYVSANGKIHVIAGDPFSDVHEVYDPIKDEWSLLAPITASVQHVKGVVANDKIYIMGGLQNWERVTRRNQVYDIKTDSWSQLAPLLIAKHNYSSIVHNDKIYIFGGDVFSADEGIWASSSSIEVYDIKTDTWESLGNMPTYLFYGGIVVYGDEVIILGGFRDTDQEARVDIFSLDTHTWREGLPLPVPLVALGAVEYNDQLYVCGGADYSKDWLPNTTLYQISIEALLENVDE